MTKTHFSQFLDIGRPLQTQLNDVLRAADRIEKAKRDLQYSQTQLQTAEAEYLQQLREVYTEQEIQAAKEQFNKFKMG